TPVRRYAVHIWRRVNRLAVFEVRYAGSIDDCVLLREVVRREVNSRCSSIAFAAYVNTGDVRSGNYSVALAKICTVITYIIVHLGNNIAKNDVAARLKREMRICMHRAGERPRCQRRACRGVAVVKEGSESGEAEVTLRSHLRLIFYRD